MTWSLLVLCAAASAVIAFGTSAVLGAGLALFRQRLVGLTAAAEARVLFGIALLPMLACCAVMTAAFAPSFGWIVDHCTQAADPHAHPHICIAHHVSALPAVTLVGLAAMLLVRILAAVVQFARGTVAALLTRRALLRMSDFGEDGVRVLPFDEPQGFVVGAFRPAVFVTRGLLSNAHREHLAPVLSHERAHLRRRDPLRRLAASIALGFHLPGLAAWLERRLARAHEIAADADAAAELHDAERVARALVRLTRAQKRTPGMATATAFAESDIEIRVAMLLDHHPRHDQPGKAVLIAAVTFMFVVVGASADGVHHGIEIVLGFLS
jgi:beta-lactamase regulating signal transducer with metallopeptidase domain